MRPRTRSRPAHLCSEKSRVSSRVSKKVPSAEHEARTTRQCPPKVENFAAEHEAHPMSITGIWRDAEESHEYGHGEVRQPPAKGRAEGAKPAKKRDWTRASKVNNRGQRAEGRGQTRTQRVKKCAAPVRPEERTLQSWRQGRARGRGLSLSLSLSFSLSPAHGVPGDRSRRSSQSAAPTAPLCA